MGSHLKFANFYLNWPTRIPLEFPHWLLTNRWRTPCAIGLTRGLSFSDHLTSSSMSEYSQCDPIPANQRRRRILKSMVLKDTKKKIILSHKTLRRKQDLILEHNSNRKSRESSKIGCIVEGIHLDGSQYIVRLSHSSLSLPCPFLVQENYLISCYILAIAGISDFLDGFIARIFEGQASKLGSFLDPLADKVLVVTVCSTLTFNGIIPVVLTSIIVARDVFLAAAGFYIRYQSLPPPKSVTRYFDPSHATAQLAPTFISKVNTFVQLGTICGTLSAPVLGFQDYPLLIYMWWITGATTILSAASYAFSSNTYKILKEAKAK